MTESEEPFQEVKPKKKRPQRKVQYGTSNVRGASGATAEAAPYEVFIGNTHPDTTTELIREILTACAADVQGEGALDEELELLEVECLTRPRQDRPPPRSKPVSYTHLTLPTKRIV